MGLGRRKGPKRGIRQGFATGSVRQGECAERATEETALGHWSQRLVGTSACD